MPSRTFLVAAAGAVTGALATAFFLHQLFPTESSPFFHSTVAPEPRVLSEIVDPVGIFQYGTPGPIFDRGTRHAYISAFDRRMRNPAWVAEHITAESLLLHDGNRRHSRFVEDHDIPEKFRAKLRDYQGSGYDRGHQVPAADAKWSQPAMDETFLLTNMCPQVGDGFNRDYWAHFEDFCRRLTKPYPSIRIITGPLYLPHRTPDGKWVVEYEVIGNPPNVAVPTHFFKVILGEGKVGEPGSSIAVGAFILPNKEISNDTPLTEFEVPVEVVERASGLELLANLDVANRRKLCGEVTCSLNAKEFLQEASGNDGKAEQQPLGKK